jgi:hypothetical protein
MNPDSLIEISDTVAYDSVGKVYLRVDEHSDEWTPMAEYKPVESTTSKDLAVTLDVEEKLDKSIRDLFPGGLVNENDKVQIRVLDGRLVWIRSDLMEQKWQELTPNLAEEIAKGGKEMKLPVEVAKKIEVQEPESYEIGWYQDSKGDLYQFDGETWLGNVPSKNETNHLEFLG